jgi:hypothetical protein
LFDILFWMNRREYPSPVLMFQPGDITHVRTFPFWRVRVGDRTLYVDQLGTLYGKLLPAIPGD